MRIAGRWRAVAAVVAAVLVLLGGAAVAYRVLAPAEVVTPARPGYPPAEQVPPGVIGTLNAAPLIVDGRLRVYATTRQIRADQPVDAPTRRTPYWSYRRWPAQVVGVAAVGTIVVGRWSDGAVVALDAHSGRVAWRVTGPSPQGGYAGRRTGASTVYAPSGLLTATASDGGAVLVLAGSLGLDPRTGRELWRHDTDPACRADALTTASGQLLTVDRCATPETVEFRDVRTGETTGRWRPEGAGPTIGVLPVGCRVAHSDCPAIRTTENRTGDGARGWLVAGTADPARPVAAAPLDDPGATLVDGAAVRPEGTDVVARTATGGTERWRFPGPARILAVQPGRVHLRTDSGDLVTVDAESGAELSRFPLTQGRDSTTWSPGFAYASDGFLVVERLAEPVEPAADDSRYYLAAQPVILAAT